MPQLPRYNSQQSLTIEKPAVEMQNSAAPYEMTEKALGAVSDVVQKWDDAVTTAQLNAYKANLGIFLADIKSRATLDPDQNGYDRYNKEIKKFKSEALKGMTNPRAKAEAMSDLDVNLSLAQIQIGGLFRKKIIDNAQDNLKTALNGFKDQVLEAPSQGTMDSAYSNAYSLIDNNVNSLLISKEQGEILKAKFDSDTSKSIVERDILANPNLALNELQKGNSGVYKNLPYDDRIHYIKSAAWHQEKMANQEREAIAIAVNQRESDLIDMKINGTLTETNVREEREAGKISARFADSMINALNSPKTVGNKGDAKTFNKIAELILNPNKTESDIKNELLIKNAVGEIKDDDFKTLNTFFQNVTKETVDKAMPKKTWLERLFNNGKDAGIRQEKLTGMFKQYMQRVNSGEDPAKAVSEVTDLYLNQHLTEQLNKPNRQYATNPENKKRAYSDDGGNTWFDEKTGELIQ